MEIKMKKLFILLAFVLPLSLNAGLLGLGLRAGLTLSKPVENYDLMIIPDEVMSALDQAQQELLSSTQDELSFNMGFSFGVYYDIKLIPGLNLLNIRPELAFNQRSAKVPKEYKTVDALAKDIALIQNDGTVNFLKDWETKTMNYGDLILPLVVTLPVPFIDIYALGGYFIGFKLSGSDDANSFEHGFIVGAGLGFDMSIVNFGIEGRYEQTLSEIWKEGDSSHFQTATISLYLEF